MPSDTYILTISDAGVSVPTDGSVTNAKVAADANIAFSKLAPLTSGNILVGNATNKAASVAMSGDITISNAGVTSIASGAIVNADINASAAIAHNKLANMTSGNILVGNSTNVPASVPVSGDLTLSYSGAATIANDSVSFAKMQPVAEYTILGKATSGSGDITEIALSPYMLTSGTGLLRQADAAAARSTLGLGSLATQSTISVANGGTGLTSYTVGDLIYANTTSSLTKLPAVATGNVLLSGGNETAPAYGKVGLTTHVSGILPVANGGTGGNGTSIDGLTFDTLKFKTTSQSSGNLTVGSLRWNSSVQTLDLRMAGTDITHRVGEELLMRVHSSSSVTTGKVVYISGSNLGLPSVTVASPSDTTSKKTLGVVVEAISAGQDGFIKLYGIVGGLDLAAYTSGQEVWLTSSGNLTGTEPSHPTHKVRVGYVIEASDGDGSLYACPRFFENGIVNGTGKIGYTTGAGGAVTQLTSKSTGVTLDRLTGQITMNNAALAANTVVSFTLTNSKLEANDVFILNHVSGGTLGSYLLNGRCTSNGSATIDVRNITSGSLSEAIVISYAVIKTVIA